MEHPYSLKSWAPIAGKWEIKKDILTYLGPGETTHPNFPFGLILSEAKLRSGRISARVVLPENARENSGRLLFGYNPETRGYLTAGIGGYGLLYVLDEFVEARGWRALGTAGTASNIPPTNAEYDVEVHIRGQRVSLVADQVQVVVYSLPRPLEGDQVGLFAWENGPVRFETARVSSRKPTAFVVMQFGEPYDALYGQVIKPVVEARGLEVYRVDEVYRPGIILQDITSGIIESEVVIAEITPPNPNVFYELGYSHAVGKPTILLAERGKDLPFDIKGFRCIFYDNTIKGKKDVEDNLSRHLSSILQEP